MVDPTSTQVISDQILTLRGIVTVARQRDEHLDASKSISQFLSLDKIPDFESEKELLLSKVSRLIIESLQRD